jgi:hypothetical protein
MAAADSGKFKHHKALVSRFWWFPLFAFFLIKNSHDSYKLLVFQIPIKLIAFASLFASFVGGAGFCGSQLCQFHSVMLSVKMQYSLQNSSHYVVWDPTE